MDDEYELVPKELIGELREENERLKNQVKELRQKNENEDFSKDKKKGEDLFKEVIFTIQEESKKERKILFEELNKIKELNEKSLTISLSKSDQLELRLEKIVEEMKSMVESLSVVVEEMSSGENSKIEALFNKLNSHLNESKNENEKNSSYVGEENLDNCDIDEKLSNIENKLEYLELFMNNLKVLLSYVKPTDFSIDKKQDKN